MEFEQDAVCQQLPQIAIVHSHHIALGLAVEGAEPFRVRLVGHRHQLGNQLATAFAVGDEHGRLRVVDEAIGRGGGAELGVEENLRVGVEAIEDALAFGTPIPAASVVAALLPVVQPEECLDGLGASRSAR